MSTAFDSPFLVTVNAPGTAVPAAGTTTSVANAGTAVVAATGPMSGGYITNPTTAPGLLYVDPVGNAGTVESATTFALSAGQTFQFGPFRGNVTACSASNTHAFCVVVW